MVASPQPRKRWPANWAPRCNTGRATAADRLPRPLGLAAAVRDHGLVLHLMPDGRRDASCIARHARIARHVLTAYHALMGVPPALKGCCALAERVRNP